MVVFHICSTVKLVMKFLGLANLLCGHAYVKEVMLCWSESQRPAILIHGSSVESWGGVYDFCCKTLREFLMSMIVICCKDDALFWWPLKYCEPCVGMVDFFELLSSKVGFSVVGFPFFLMNVVGLFYRSIIVGLFTMVLSLNSICRSLSFSI